MEAPLQQSPNTLRGPHIMTGPDNPLWLGDGIKYNAAHDRIRVRRGRAVDHPCVDCGRQAMHWSYNHSDPNEQTCEGLPYSTDANHYSPRCVPCHKAFDLYAPIRGTLRVQ